MLNHMKTIGLVLLIAPLTVLMSTYLSSCNNGNGGSASIPVTVMDYSAKGLPNVTVVLGDSNGAMKDYGTTDANGQITFVNAPDDATVTAALSCLGSGESNRTYFIDSEYDVNGPASLYLDTCTGFSDMPAFDRTPIGTVTVHLNNPLSNMAHYLIYTSNWIVYWGYGALTTQQTLTITQGDLQSDGKLSLLVIGTDANYTSIGYGVLLDQTFTDGRTVDIAVNQPLSFVQYQITNIPQTAKKFFPFLCLSRTGKGGIVLGEVYSLSSTPSSATFKVPTIPDWGDRIKYGITTELDQNNNGFPESSQDLDFSAIPSTVPLDQIIDLSLALRAPSELAVSKASTARPIFSWSGVDPGATAQYVSAEIQLQAAGLLNFSGDIASTTRTNLAFPELPDSLAAFRPAGVDSFKVYTDAEEEGVYRSSSGEYASSDDLAPVSGKSKALGQLAMKKRMRMRQEKSWLQNWIARF